MPSRSPVQRRLFGLALSIKRKRGKARRRALRKLRKGSAVRRLLRLPTKTLREYAKNPTGYPFSSNLFRPATRRGRPRYYRRSGRSWDEVQLREAFFPSPGKPRGYGRKVTNPLTRANPWYVVDGFGVVSSGPHKSQDSARNAIRVLRGMSAKFGPPGQRAALAKGLRMARATRKRYGQKARGHRGRHRTAFSKSYSYRVGQEVPRLRKNPVLQVVGLPARFLGNPLPPFLASALGGAGAGLGFHAVNSILRRNGRKRRRGRR